MGGALDLRGLGALWLRDSVGRARGREEGFRKKENSARCADTIYLDPKRRRRRFRRGRRRGFVERLFFPRNRPSCFALRRSGRGRTQSWENRSSVSLRPGGDRGGRNLSRYARANIGGSART